MLRYSTERSIAKEVERARAVRVGGRCSAPGPVRGSHSKFHTRRPSPFAFISGRWRLSRSSRSESGSPSPQPLRTRSRPGRLRRSGRPSSTFTRISSGTGRRRRSTPWGWRWRRNARPTIAGCTSTSSTRPGSWTPPWTAWTPTALRRWPCGRHSGNGSESWRR